MSATSKSRVVLVVDGDESRRRAVALGLAESRYEAVPVIETAEGDRFLQALKPDVVVAADPDGEKLGEVASLLSSAVAQGATGLLLGPVDDVVGVPDDVLRMSASGLSGEELVKGIRLLLLARELSLQSDLSLECLVGDLSRMPFFDLLPRLHESGVSGRLLLPRGEIHLWDGEVVGAWSRSVRGLKAFCRLARFDDGPFRLEPGSDDLTRDLSMEFDLLLAQAVDESLGEMLEPQTRVVVEVGPALSSEGMEELPRKVLGAVDQGVEVAVLLDALEATDGEILRVLYRLREAGAVRLGQAVPRITVVTDSSSDLPLDLVRDLALQVVPLSILFGSRSYLDGEELSPKRFYELLDSEGEHPATNPPSVAQFRQRYEELQGAGEVLSIHISQKMSLTLIHAREAAREVAEAGSGVTIVDSRQVSVPLGLLCVFAARMASRGLELSDISNRLETMKERLETLFVVNTLDYLVRGGRVGRAQGWVGKLLGIRPILGVSQGEVVPVDRVRGGRAAQIKLMDLFEERVDPARPVIVGIAHSAAPVWADRLGKLLQERFQISEAHVTEMGPVVGTHVGPGTVGATLFQPQGDETELLAPLS